MKLAAFALIVLTLSGCAERIVQDVHVTDQTLIVRECLLQNGGIFQQKCVERKYPLAQK